MFRCLLNSPRRSATPRLYNLSIAILNELWTEMSLKSSPGKELHV